LCVYWFTGESSWTWHKGPLELSLWPGTPSYSWNYAMAMSDTKGGSAM
jgi:hypothetical protein